MRDQYLQTRLSNLLKRMTPPRVFSFDESSQVAEVSQMMRVLRREAPTENYEKWWGTFEANLLDAHQTRAWPTINEFVNACQKISLVASPNHVAVDQKYTWVLKWFEKKGMAFPSINEPSITMRLIRDGHLSSERQARFLGFALSDEAAAKARQQRPCWKEWEHHVRVTAKIRGVDYKTAEAQVRIELPEHELPAAIVPDNFSREG